jgi:hypothetical protein
MLKDMPEKMSSGPKDLERFEAVRSGIKELLPVVLRLSSVYFIIRNTNFTLSREITRHDIIMCHLTDKGADFDSRCLFLLDALPGGEKIDLSGFILSKRDFF